MDDSLDDGDDTIMKAGVYTAMKTLNLCSIHSTSMSSVVPGDLACSLFANRDLCIDRPQNTPALNASRQKKGPRKESMTSFVPKEVDSQTTRASRSSAFVFDPFQLCCANLHWKFVA